MQTEIEKLKQRIAELESTTHLSVDDCLAHRCMKHRAIQPIQEDECLICAMEVTHLSMGDREREKIQREWFIKGLHEGASQVRELYRVKPEVLSSAAEENKDAN